MFDFNNAELNMLVEDVIRLEGVLKAEKKNISEAESREIELSKDLIDLKQKLAEQKSQNAMYIKQMKEKETELDEIQEDTAFAEIQAEKNMNKRLQEELNSAQMSYRKLKIDYNCQVNVKTKEAEILQEQLDTEKKANADKISQDQQLIDKMRAERDNFRQEMVKEKTLTQQKSKEMKESLQTELETANNSYQELCSKYETDFLAARQNVERLQMDLTNEMMAHTKAVTDNLKLFDKLRAEQEAGHEKLAREIESLKQTSIQTEIHFQAELDEIKNQIQLVKNMTEEALEKKKKKSPPFWKRLFCLC